MFWKVGDFIGLDPDSSNWLDPDTINTNTHHWILYLWIRIPIMNPVPDPWSKMNPDLTGSGRNFWQSVHCVKMLLKRCNRYHFLYSISNCFLPPPILSPRPTVRGRWSYPRYLDLSDPILSRYTLSEVSGTFKHLIDSSEICLHLRNLC